MRKSFISWALLLTFLVGCGTAPTAPSTPRQPRQPAYPTQPMPQQPQPTNAGPVLMRLQQSWSQVRTLSAHLDFWQQKGSERETAKLTCYYRKPGRYRYEVSKASNVIKNGSTVVFDTNQDQITARLGSVLSIIPIRSTMEDARSKSVRGHRLDQGDYATLVEAFLANGNRVQLLSNPNAPGPIAIGLANPPNVPLTDFLVLTLDPQSMLPTKIQHMAQGQVVGQTVISQYQINPSIGEDKFKL